MTRTPSWPKLDRDVLAIAGMFPTHWQSPGAIATWLTQTWQEVETALRGLAIDELMEERDGHYCITRHGLRAVRAAGGASNLFIHGGNTLPMRKRKKAA